jgi:multiple sugar transport system substrate-binding protein
MTVRLRGLCWDHPRCLRPMAAAADAYRRVRPDVRLEWRARPLALFNDQPVDEVAADYDLVFVDHPMTGSVAAGRSLVPLDTVLDAGELAGIAERSIGGSHDSYRCDGHQWALGVDAACQVAAFHSDRLPTALPTTWDDVLALARSAPGSVALPLYPSDAICTLVTLSAGAAVAAGEPATWLHPDGADLLVELAGLVDPWCYGVNPPALLNAMAGDGPIAYVPAVFGYATLNRPPLRFADLPGVRGAVLGGAGLGVSASSRHVADAAAFAAWCLRTDTQRDVLLPAGGQPGDRLVWDDPAADRLTGGFLSATRRTVDAAHVRPREPWWPGFQRDAGLLLVDLLRDGATGRRLVKELTVLADRARP